MQRLLQGEVGSGKTVVAVAAMMQAVGSGGQAVLVAPTQVLAEQHYASISKMVAKLTDADDKTASAIQGNSASTQVSKVQQTGESTQQTINNNAVDKGAQLVDLLDITEISNVDNSNNDDSITLRSEQSHISDAKKQVFQAKGTIYSAQKMGRFPYFFLREACDLPNAAAYSPQPHQACPASSWRRTPHFQEFPGAEPHTGGNRRTASLRCGATRIVEFQGDYCAASAGHDSHADSAHRSHDLVRRS